MLFIGGDEGGVVEGFLRFLHSKSQEHWSGDLTIRVKCEVLVFYPDEPCGR